MSAGQSAVDLCHIPVTRLRIAFGPCGFLPRGPLFFARQQPSASHRRSAADIALQAPGTGAVFVLFICFRIQQFFLVCFPKFSQTKSVLMPLIICLVCLNLNGINVAGNVMLAGSMARQGEQGKGREKTMTQGEFPVDIDFNKLII